MILLFILFCNTLSFAQIPNPSFETWTSGRPNGWHSYRHSAPYTFEMQDNNSHLGSYALKSIVYPYSATILLTAGIMTGDVTWSGINPTMEKYGYIAGTEKPSKLVGWYIFDNKFNTDDTLIANIWFKKSGIVIGSGQFTTATGNTVYKQFVVNVNYISSLEPDSFKIFISFNKPDKLRDIITGGEYFIVDNLAFDNSTGIENNNNKEREIKVYPNPANELLTIQILDINSKITSAEIYNSSGQLVQEFKPDDNVFHINTQNYSSGLYHYKLMLNDGTNRTGRFVKQ